MPSFNDVVAGSSADSSCIQQVVDALKGTAGKGVPISITAVSDAANWALDVRNQEAVNSRSFRVQNAAGATQIQADINGVALNQVTISSGTITGSTITNSRLSNPTVSSASPGTLVARLDSTTLTSSAASMTLTVTSSAYQHLEIDVVARSDDATLQFTNIFVQVNNDTGSNYDFHSIRNSTAGVVSFSAAAGSSAAEVGFIPGSSATAGFFGQTSIRINGYASTVHQKQGHADWNMKGANSTTAVLLGMHGFNWRSSNGITSFTLTPGSGGFSSGSRATLYGKP